MKKTISILGCGWLGTPLAEFLIHKGHVVNGSTRDKKKYDLLKQKGVKPFLIDLEHLPKTISKFITADVLIIATTCKNLEAQKLLIAKLKVAAVTQIIFISSTSVYPLSNQIVTEVDKTNTSILSYIEKEYIANTPATIIRFSGLIGPKRNPSNFFKNGKIVKQPEGYVNLIHLKDCINLIDLIIENKVNNTIFNACADTHPKRIDFYTKLAKRSKTPVPTFNKLETLQYKIVSNHKITQFFNYTFLYPDVLDIPDAAYY